MKRIYETLLADHFAHNRQMAFLSGPRQVGKTTLAQSVLSSARMFNYDFAQDARIILKGAEAVAEAADLANPANRCKGIVFDELHKFPKWKSLLKGFFDVYGKGLPVAVTGSARLNVYKRGGDSLMGRYFSYRIHPFTVGEFVERESVDLERLLQSPVDVPQSSLDALLRFGGYPEPLLNGSVRFYNRWRNGRLEKIFTEDLRDMSPVLDIRGVRTLGAILDERVGSVVNRASLAADLAVAPDTVKAWIGLLESSTTASSSIRGRSTSRTRYASSRRSISGTGVRLRTKARGTRTSSPRICSRTSIGGRTPGLAPLISTMCATSSSARSISL